jgi:hypothetical protein
MLSAFLQIPCQFFRKSEIRYFQELPQGEGPQQAEIFLGMM